MRDEQIRLENVYPNKLKKLKQYACGRRLLDIGAGLGTFAFVATQEGFDVTGIEFSEEQCRKAKDMYDIDLLNCNIYDIKKEFGKFDVIHLHHVMEHLTSPSRMLNIAWDLLDKNGVLLIEVPYQLFIIQNIITRTKQRNITFNYDHLYFFTPNTLKTYVREKGFNIIQFNQHRSEHLTWTYLTSPKQCVRYIFRKLTRLLWIPSGSFIEFYCRKNTGSK